MDKLDKLAQTTALYKRAQELVTENADCEARIALFLFAALFSGLEELRKGAADMGLENLVDLKRTKAIEIVSKRLIDNEFPLCAISLMASAELERRGLDPEAIARG